MRHYGRLTKVTEEGPESDGRGSFMGCYILHARSWIWEVLNEILHHAQPDGLKVLPAWLGALAGFLSANNRGLFALWESLDNDILALVRDQRQRGRVHHSHQQKALPPTMTEYDQDTHRPSQIAVKKEGEHKGKIESEHQESCLWRMNSCYRW